LTVTAAKQLSRLLPGSATHVGREIAPVELQPDRYERPKIGQLGLSPAIFVRVQVLSLRFVHAVSGAVLRNVPEGPKLAIGSVW
jgi:hypothetical protein